MTRESYALCSRVAVTVVVPVALLQTGGFLVKTVLLDTRRSITLKQLPVVLTLL